MKCCSLRWYYPEQVHSVGGDEWATLSAWLSQAPALEIRMKLFLQYEL